MGDERMSGRWRWLAATTALACSALVVLVASVLDRETVRDAADQRSLDFGLPFAWIHQDQSSLDPPYPWSATVAGPWEHPTSLSGLALALDVLVVAVVLGLVLALVRLRSSRPRSARS
jgi:hypothetical protein